MVNANNLIIDFREDFDSVTQNIYFIASTRYQGIDYTTRSYIAVDFLEDSNILSRDLIMRWLKRRLAEIVTRDIEEWLLNVRRRAERRAIQQLEKINWKEEGF